MNKIEDLHYVSRGGLRAVVEHPLDDPYIGKPKSALGLSVMKEGPVGVAWTYGRKSIEIDFQNRIQVVLDRDSEGVVVIGHWGSSILEHPRPNNGVVFNADGSLRRSIVVPSRVVNSQEPYWQTPEALTVVEKTGEGIEIWLAYCEGDWHEQRLYDPQTGEWGKVTGQYRSG
jgi:hypothetical protein